MPAAVTITTYNSFLAGTKARASEVNQNFDNYRGHLIPIDPNTVAASHNTHNLGASDHQWKSLFLNEMPYINGSQIAPLAVGMVLPYAGTSAPSGFLFCDGSALDRTTYAALFSQIGENFGAGDLSTTFNIPDMRGRFMRCADAGTGRDTSANERTSTLASISTTATIVAGTALVSDIPTATFNRILVGSRIWPDLNLTTSQARIYNNSATIASIPGAFINIMQAGQRIWGTVRQTATGLYFIPTSTIVSVNTAGFSAVIDITCGASAATSTMAFVIDAANFRTSSVASINTATTSLVMFATAMVSGAPCNISLDAGGYMLGSTQDDSVQGHGHYIKIGGAGTNNVWSTGSGTKNPYTDPGAQERDYLAGFTVCDMVEDQRYGSLNFSSETRVKNIYVNYIIKY